MGGQLADVRSAATGVPAQASARIRIAILFGLLFAVQFGAAILTPLGDSESEAYWEHLILAAIGFPAAWPALLALWAVFGPQRAGVRLPLMLWFAVVIDLCAMYGWSRNVGKTIDVMTLGAGGGWLLAFVAFQPPLWLIRMTRRWRLKLPEHENAEMRTFESCSPTTNSPRQFSLQALLGWILAAAVLLAGWRWAAPDARFGMEDILWSLQAAAALTPRVIMAGLPVVALAWIVLADGRRLVLRVLLSLLVLAGLSGVYACSERIGKWLLMSPAEMMTLEAGAMLNGLVSFGVVRASGYRLRRHAKKRDGVTACYPQAHGTISPLRFAVALAPLVAIAASLAWSVPHRLAQWRRAEIEFGWHEIGLEASFDEDGVATGLKCIHKPPLPDEICRRIASLGELRVLDLRSSTIDDRQLAMLCPLTHLENLDLSSTAITNLGLKQLGHFPQLKQLKLENTAITDAGLADLQVLPKLESLQLSLTEVTDDGLSALERLPALKTVDVQLTAVSSAAARRFHESHPQSQIESGASFELLLGLHEKLASGYAWQSSGGPGRESHHYRVTNFKLKRLHVRGRASRNGVAKNDNGSGLIFLPVGQEELEELDLRDSEANDFSLDRLIALKKLKRLDLRGSQVSEEGVQVLARALPDCKILR